MRDFCAVDLTCLMKDKERIITLLNEGRRHGGDPEIETVLDRSGATQEEKVAQKLMNTDKIVTMSFWEVNHGGQDALEALAQEGLIFKGYNGDGENYCGSCWCAIDGVLYKPMCNVDCEPVAKVEPNGTINAESLNKARDYFAALGRVKAYLADGL